MNNSNLKPLPLGTSDFAALRSEGQIYVDKTSLIYEIASKRQKFFLSRPRRFGKSLLISTFESLFKYGLRDFKGLAIEKLWRDTGTYQVVRLDFSEIKDFSSAEEFSVRLTSVLSRGFSGCGFTYRESPIETVSDQISDWLKTIPLNSLVLLIDEYDAPLTACLSKPQLFEDIRKKLSDFYATIKSNDGAVRFFFMTGITKFSKTSIFSELNHFTDLSLMAEFGSLLGYTHAEVEQYFSGYLDRAAEILNMDRGDLLSELTRHYDGFCFEKTAKQHLFSPWSLLKFLNYPSNGFENYWYESGGKPTALLQYFQSHSLKSPLDFDKEKLLDMDDLTASSDVDEISDVALLTQAGYLTIKNVEEDTAFVGYPNLEVKKSMAPLYMKLLLKGQTQVQAGAGGALKILTEGSAQELYHRLNRLFLSLDYQSYPAKDEYAVRGIVQIYVTCTGLSAKVENHNALGRSDLEVRAGNNYWVFEFKYCREGENSEQLLQEAVEQIQNRHYGEQVSTEKLIKVALVFSEKERQFIRWKSLD